MQKKAQDAAAKERRDQDPASPPERAEPRRQSVAQQVETVAGDLEAQLRRWMQGETSPKAPPVVLAETPRPAPPVRVHRVNQTAPVPVSVTGHAQALDTHLQQSGSVAKRANELQRAALHHLKDSRRAGAKLVQPGAVIRKSRSREIASAVDMLRTPRTVRQAFVASFILASPKGLEG